MPKVSLNGRCNIKAENLDKISNIRHGFTTAKGGFSSGKIDGLKEARRIVEKHFNGKEQE